MQITWMQKEFVKALKKNFVEYHYFYLKSDSLLLVVVLEHLGKISLKFCHLDPAKVLSALGLAARTFQLMPNSF